MATHFLKNLRGEHHKILKECLVMFGHFSPFAPGDLSDSFLVWRAW